MNKLKGWMDFIAGTLGTAAAGIVRSLWSAIVILLGIAGPVAAFIAVLRNAKRHTLNAKP